MTRKLFAAAAGVLALFALTACEADYFDITSCSLDGAPFEPCTSPVHYENLPLGRHRVVVKVERYVKDADGEGHHLEFTDTDERKWTVRAD